jgi:hypothetical protein
MALADQAEDYRISKRAVQEIHRGPVSASRRPNLMWDRGPSETVLTGERPIRPARRRFPDRYGMRDTKL